MAGHGGRASLARHDRVSLRLRRKAGARPRPGRGRRPGVLGAGPAAGCGDGGATTLPAGYRRRAGQVVCAMARGAVDAESRAMAEPAAAMPDACRAIAADPSAPQPSAEVVLSGFVERALDHLVRSAAVPAPSASHATIDSFDEQWLAALTQLEGKLEGDRAALEQLRHRVRDWWRPVSSTRPVRSGFAFASKSPQSRLRMRTEQTIASRPPKAHGASAISCRRIAIPVSCSPLPTRGRTGSRRRSFSVSGSGILNLHEYLLQSLGEAARLCPLVEESLRGAMPESAKIDAWLTRHRFVSSIVNFLDQAGFGVILPAGWTSRARACV